MTQTVRPGLLDTSTLILLGRINDHTSLPDDAYVSAITLAELSVGPLVATSESERAARQAHLQQAESDFEAIPFDSASARTFGRVATSLRSAGRKPAARAYHALIAACAVAHGIPLYTVNPADFLGTADLVVHSVAHPDVGSAP